VDAPIDAVQSVFVQEVLEKCVRLSYYERVAKTIPSQPDLTSLMPPQPQPQYTYESKTNRVDAAVPLRPSSGSFLDGACVDEGLVPLADRVIEAMRLKQKVDQVMELCEEIRQFAVTNGVESKMLDTSSMETETGIFI
jgi:hypothetical protein